MEKQLEREKPQIKKHGPHQWRANYKGRFGQAKTPELAYLRLVELLHEQLEMEKRNSSEMDDFSNSEIKALKAALKECKEKHQYDISINKDKYDRLLNDFRSQGEALGKLRNSQVFEQSWREEKNHLLDQVIVLKGKIKEMEKEKSLRC